MKRGGSLLGSGFQPHQSLLARNNEIQYSQQQDYKKVISSLKSSPQRLKRFLIQYKKSSTQKQQHQCFRQFRNQQQIYRNQREQLREQLQHPHHNSHQSKYIRDQLVEVIKQQMNIEIQFNQQISLKKKKKQNLVKDLQLVQGKSTRVNNALSDILQKTQEIKQLSKAIEECLELLKIIGVILEEQGGQLDEVERLVKDANQNVYKTGKNIDEAAENMRNLTKKKCCIIFWGIFAICLILLILYGLDVFNNI